MGQRGPLPQWSTVGGFGGFYTAEDPQGVTWRLWRVEQPAANDNLPAGYRLAPLDGSASPVFVTGEYGLYRALDIAGMRIAEDAVRADPEGAARQMGFTEAPEQ